jgi:hypothetical protein
MALGQQRLVDSKEPQCGTTTCVRLGEVKYVHASETSSPVRTVGEHQSVFSIRHVTPSESIPAQSVKC